MKVTVLLVGLVLALFSDKGYATAIINTTATAIFNNNGITGWIRFTETGDGVSILANLEGLGDNADWVITGLPVLTTIAPEMRVMPAFVGDVYSPLTPATGECSSNNQASCRVGDLTGRFGQLVPNFLSLFNDTTGDLQLAGRFSVVGRSVVVTVGDKKVAATIRDNLEEVATPDPVRIFTATFFSPVAGTIYFREVADSMTGVQIYGKLYYTDGSDTTEAHNWHIHESAPVEGYQAGLGCTETVGPHYDPFMRLTNETRDDYPDLCTPELPDGCELGDLTGKFAQLTIGASPTPYSMSAFFFTDSNLTLSGEQNILGRSVAIHAANGDSPIIACAPIVPAETLFATEYDNELLLIEQSSPFENSPLNISGAYPANNPDVAIYEAVFMTNGLCPADAAPYNPYGVTNPGGETPDLFPLGDIPNKFNLEFFGPNYLELTELPLHGPNTLAGRTIRITKQVDDNTINICSALIPAKNEGGVLLKATFNDGPVQGGVILLQNLLTGSLFRGQTNVIVDLFRPNTQETSTGHGWVITDQQTCAEILGNTSSVYNPFDVDTATIDTGCTNMNQLRCQSGDMTGKHGALKLSGIGENRPSYSFNDINLQLSANYSVNGFSLAILGADGDPNAIACTTLGKREISEVEYNIFYSTQFSESFDRVDFVNDLAGEEPLAGTLPPSNIIVLNEVVGATEIDDIPCATLQMAVIAGRTQMANDYASITQTSICERFGNDRCFRTLPNFSQLCPGMTTTESGSPPLRSQVTLLLGVVLFLFVWLAF